MGRNRGKLVPWKAGDGMLCSEEAGQIFALRKLNWGLDRIATELGIARNTVRAWLKAGPDRRYGGPKRMSALGRHQEWMRERWRAGVRNGDVFRQELLAKGVRVSLRTVERALRPLRREQVVSDRATLRFETPPGKQMQIDFGEKWLEIGKVPQKRFVFVATLGHSRREYAEICFGLRQRDWILGIEHAFQHFGGVPEELLVDNAKPLVLSHPRSGKVTFHPEFLAFCQHWGVRPRACQPYRARTKGKVESGVGYVKGNALGGLTFESDAALDLHLATWLRDVADVRLHGTTFERPLERFEKAERMALRPLQNHPSYLKSRWEERKVAPDFRIDLDTNRYSVPPGLVGEVVDVLIEQDLIQVHFQDRIVAEHSVAVGRHQVVEDPGHVLTFVNGSAWIGRPSGIERPLSVYEEVVGGEPW
jgi:transposase